VALIIALVVVAYCFTAVSEGHGDTAVVLLKAGAEVDKKDFDGHLAIELAPDAKVLLLSIATSNDKKLTLSKASKVHRSKCRTRRHRYHIMKRLGKYRHTSRTRSPACKLIPRALVSAWCC